MALAFCVFILAATMLLVAAIGAPNAEQRATYVAGALVMIALAIGMARSK